MVVDEDIFVMLLTERFKDFINDEVADATHDDHRPCRPRAGRTWTGWSPRRSRPAASLGPVLEGPDVRRRLQDLDGHVWGLLHWTSSRGPKEE